MNKNTGQPSRKENIARAKFEGGIAKDTDKGNFKDRNHKYGYQAVSMEGLDLGKPWRASEDPTHNCQDNGCKVGKHYMRPVMPGRGILDP